MRMSKSSSERWILGLTLRGWVWIGVSVRSALTLLYANVSDTCGVCKEQERAGAGAC